MVTGCCLNYDYFISRGQFNSETDELGQEETHPDNKMESRWKAQDSWNEWIKGEEEYMKSGAMWLYKRKMEKRRMKGMGLNDNYQGDAYGCLRRRLMFCNGPLWFRLLALNDERLYLAVVSYKHYPHSAVSHAMKMVRRQKPRICSGGCNLG